MTKYIKPTIETFRVELSFRFALSTEQGVQNPDKSLTKGTDWGAEDDSCDGFGW